MHYYYFAYIYSKHIINSIAIQYIAMMIFGLCVGLVKIGIFISSRAVFLLNFFAFLIKYSTIFLNTYLNLKS